MISRIGAFEAKTNFSKLLERVAGGEHIVVTRNGRPVAEIVPYREDSGVDPVRAAIDGLTAARRGVTLGRLTIRQLIDEGRR
ncbi:MAG: type II toxin-antitoxin system prevent-host-death family antitoxin [Phycisphaerales bacterium]